MESDNFGCTLVFAMAALLVAVVLILILNTHGVFDDPIYPSVEMDTLSLGGISVPAGYVLSAIVESPNHTDEVVMFCTNSETRKLVPCTNGVIGEAIEVPVGYTVIQGFRERQEEKTINFVCQNDANPADVVVCVQTPSIKY